MPVESKTNVVQMFDSRYIDRSRLETLLKTLHDGKPWSVQRELGKWRVEAPGPLTPRQIEALRH